MSGAAVGLIGAAVVVGYLAVCWVVAWVVSKAVSAQCEGCADCAYPCVDAEAARTAAQAQQAGRVQDYGAGRVQK